MVDPGARPSDVDPEEWVDVEPPSDGQPCCELGEPIEVTPPGYSGGVVAVEWHGEGWGVLFNGGRDFARGLQYASLDPMVTRVEVYREIPIGLMMVEDVHWAAGRFGVLHGAGADVVRLGFLDRAGAQDGSWISIDAPSRAAVGRQGLGNLWTVATGARVAVPTDPQRHALRVLGFDGDGALVAEHPLGGTLGANDDALVVEGLVSRSVIAWIEDDRMRAQSVVVGDGVLGPPLDLGEARTGPDGSLGSDTFRDSMAITQMDGASVWLTLVNPFEGTHSRSLVGASTIGDRSAGVAGVDKHGLLGVCIPVGDGTHGGGGSGDDGVDFQILGSDGSPWGDPVEVVSGLMNIGGCAVGFHVDSFIVVWWRASGDHDYNSIWARRVGPRLGL